MKQSLAERAGAALVWKLLHLGGLKVIFLARTVILARLLLPDDFGLLAVSLIAVDFLTSITELGMIPALIQRQELDERHYHAAWTAGVTRAGIITLAVMAAAPLIAAWLGEPRAVPLIRVMAFRPLLAALASIKIAALTRQLDFRRLAIIGLPEALVNTVLSIVLAPALGVWGLVIGALTGQVALVLMSYWLAPVRPRLVFAVAAIRPLLHFGRWLLLASVFSLAGRLMLQVVITQRLGVAELGLYYLAVKLAFIPAEVTGDVVGSVTFPLYARLQGNGPGLVSTFRSIFIGMAALVFPMCTLMVVLAPAVVATVLGPRWEGTTALLQLLALVNVLGLFGDTVVPIFKGLGQPHRLIVIEVLQSAVLIVVIWGLTGRFGVLNAAYAWLAAVGASQFVSAQFLRRMLPQPFAGLGAPLLAIGAACLLGGLTAWFVSTRLPDLLGLALAGLSSIVVIGLLLWVADRRFAFGLGSGLRRAFPRLSLVMGTTPADG